MPENRNCEVCGQPFTCEIAAGKPTCWCFALPREAEVPPPEAGCLCPPCLQARLKENDQPSKS